MFEKIKRLRFEKICRDIKSIKIQGARNVAKAALKAYEIIPTEDSRKKLLSLRPTEPMLKRVLEMTKKQNPEEILRHFDYSQEEINKFVLKLIKSKDVIYTHCHSSNVVNSLIYAKRRGKNFEVYNTETRPLYQGRKTTKELSRKKIPVTLFVDSAINVALTKSQGTKKATKVFLGADAILEKGVINKIGSGLIAKIANKEKIPVYIIADSWKFSEEEIELEQRKLNEIWDTAPEKIKIKNPAFEFVEKNYIKGVVSEFGILSLNEFIKKFKEKYD
jgi:ribose 1,5-bisphosphate isomerase